MENIGFWVALITFALLAAGAIGVAYGYRGQRDIERDQVTYLRKKLEALEPPPANSRSLSVAGGRP